MMTDEEYLQIQHQLAALAVVFANVDVEGFLERAERADAVAPIIDPTLWLRGRDKLQAVKRLAEAGARFKGAALEFRNTMLRLEAEAGMQLEK